MISARGAKQTAVTYFELDGRLPEPGAPIIIRILRAGGSPFDTCQSDAELVDFYLELV